MHPHTSALGQAYIWVSPSTITSSYQPKHNHQVSTLWYKPQVTPTSSFFFTTQCTMSGTPHTTRPSMYQPVVHSLERTPFLIGTTHPTLHVWHHQPHPLEHLLGHNTQPVSDDVPHPQVPLRI